MWNEWISTWWAWVVPLSIQVALLGAGVFCIERLLGRRLSARAATLLWCLVLAKLFVPPSLSSPVSVAAIPALSSSAQTAFVDVATIDADAGLALEALAFVAWILGAIGLFALTIWRKQRLNSALRLHAVPLAHDAHLAGVLDELATRVGMQRAPHALLTPSALGPAVFGSLRPSILLPRKFAQDATPTQIEHVLLHELTHIRRHDPLASLVCQLAQIVFWFHPAVWLMRKRLEVLRELACDRQVARSLNEAAPEYRNTLLSLARSHAIAAHSLSTAFLAGRSSLLLRLDALQRAESGSSRSSVLGRTALCVLGLSLGCCIMPMAPSVVEASPLQVSASSSEFELPRIEDTRGCLQLRYLVMARIAQQQTTPQP